MSSLSRVSADCGNVRRWIDSVNVLHFVSSGCGGVML